MRIPVVNYSGMIAEFMTKHKQTIRDYPQIPEDGNERELRRKLIAEEAMETCEALANSDLILIADGLADLLYVVFGTALSYGIPMETIFTEVHRSNMSKPKLGHTMNGTKVEKGSYSKPQIATLLEQRRLLIQSNKREYESMHKKANALDENF